MEKEKHTITPATMVPYPLTGKHVRTLVAAYAERAKYQILYSLDTDADTALTVAVAAVVIEHWGVGVWKHVYPLMCAQDWHVCSRIVWSANCVCLTDSLYVY